MMKKLFFMGEGGGDPPPGLDRVEINKIDKVAKKLNIKMLKTCP